MKQVFWSALLERSVMRQPFRCFMKMAHRAGQLGYTYIDAPHARPDVARDYICSEFKKLTQNPDDVLVMCDIDHNHSFDILEQLVANDKPVCAAYAVKSNPGNPLPCMWRRDQNGILRIPRPVEKELMQVAITGSGAIAIKRSVFTVLDNAGFDKGYWKYQYYPDGSSGSEEIFFSQICEEVGIPIFVDGRIVTPHWTEGELDDTSYEAWCIDNPEIHREHKVSVIIPQRGRFDKLRTCLESLHRTAPECEVILVTDIDESDKLDCVDWIPSEVRRVTWGVVPQRAIDKWNYGATLATGDILMLASNDVFFHPDWLKWALDAFTSLPNEEGVAGTNDLHTNGHVSSPHYLVSRKWLVENYGGALACPAYKFSFIDYDICHKAMGMGQYAWAQGSIVSHDHPQTNSAEIDNIHREGYLAGSFEDDRALFLERQKQGFPVTWKPILK